MKKAIIHTKGRENELAKRLSTTTKEEMRWIEELAEAWDGIEVYVEKMPLSTEGGECTYFLVGWDKENEEVNEKIKEAFWVLEDDPKELGENFYTERIDFEVDWAEGNYTPCMEVHLAEGDIEIIEPENGKIQLFRAILHTDGFTVDEKDAEEKKYSEEELKIITDYMQAWDGVRVTVSALMPGEFSVVGWPPEEDEKVKNAIYLMEQDLVFGMYVDDRERFDADWAAGEWEPSGSIVFSPAMVEIIGELGGKDEQ